MKRILLLIVALSLAAYACGSGPAAVPEPASDDSQPIEETIPPISEPTLAPTIIPFTQVPVPTSVPTSSSAEMTLAGLVYLAPDPTTGNPALWQINTDGRHTPLLPAGTAYISPNYQFAAYQDNGIWITDFLNQSTIQLQSEAREYLTIYGWLTPEKIVVGAKPNNYNYIEILSVRATDGQPDNPFYFTPPCLGISPHGKIAVFTNTEGPILGWVGIYTDNSTESAEIIMENLPKYPCPAWSPNGNKMAWLTSRIDTSQPKYIYSLEIHDPGNPSQVTGVHETTDIFLSYADYFGFEKGTSNDYITWASGSQRLAFATQAEDGIISFWISTTDGESEYQLPNWPIWNPVKPWLAYWDFEHDPAKPELWIMETNGENAQMVGTRSGGIATEAYLSTLWSPDGELLLYQDVDGTMWLTDFDTRQAQKVDINFQGELATWIPPLNVTLSELVALPTPIPFSCPNAPAPRVQVGQTARVTITGSGGTRLRSSPDVLPNNILASLVEGQEFEIIGEPVCSERPGRDDAYVYWEVSIPAQNLTGWVAEGDFEEYYIEPWP